MFSKRLVICDVKQNKFPIKVKRVLSFLTDNLPVNVPGTHAQDFKLEN